MNSADSLALLTVHKSGDKQFSSMFITSFNNYVLNAYRSYKLNQTKCWHSALIFHVITLKSIHIGPSIDCAPRMLPGRLNAVISLSNTEKV